MATPKDYIVYIEKGTNETIAILNIFSNDERRIKDSGHKIIGYVSSGSEADAIKYANAVLR